MPHKQIKLPIDVVRDFLRDMNAFFAEENAVEADAIVARQLRALEQYYIGGTLRFSDVKQLFLQMKEPAQGNSQLR